MTELALSFLKEHGEEIKSLVWLVIPVLIGAEWLARFIMRWVDVIFPKMGARLRENLSGAIGLTANGVIASLFVLNFGRGSILYLTCFYAGVTTILHAIAYWILKKYRARKG